MLCLLNASEGSGAWDGCGFGGFGKDTLEYGKVPPLVASCYLPRGLDQDQAPRQDSEVMATLGVVSQLRVRHPDQSSRFLSDVAWMIAALMDGHEDRLHGKADQKERPVFSRGNAKSNGIDSPSRNSSLILCLFSLKCFHSLF